jgi:hypothetical protein
VRQLQGTLVRLENGIGHRAHAVSRVELVHGPQLRDVAQGHRNLPLVPARAALGHDVRQSGLFSAGPGNQMWR